MKRKKLDMGQLGMMSNAIMKGLYPQPSKTCILVDEPPNYSEDRHYLYFSSDYYQKLIQTMNNHVAEGKYASSNAESDWLDLVKAVSNAEDYNPTDFSKLKPYWLAK